MRHRLTVFCLTVSVAAFVCAVGAPGQVSISTNAGPSGVSGSATFSGPEGYGQFAITGAPYSGEEVGEQVQTLADGTHITRKNPGSKMYRDSFGRTRTERPINASFIATGRNQDLGAWIEITDPVAHVKYVLDPMNKVAHKQQLPTTPQVRVGRAAAPSAGSSIVGTAIGISSGGVIRSATPATPAENAPTISRDKLGTQTMEGVLVEGNRITRTYPVGSMGNDRPVSVVIETWMSPDLKVMVMSKNSDPRSGEHIQKLTNISTSEPSASLFQPPSDYSVVEETGGFTIKWGTQQ